MNSIDLRLNERYELKLEKGASGLLVVSGDMVSYGFIADLNDVGKTTIRWVAGYNWIEFTAVDIQKVRLYSFLEEEFELKALVEDSKLIDFDKFEDGEVDIEPSEMIRFLELEQHATYSINYVEKVFGFEPFQSEEQISGHVLTCGFFEINGVNFPTLTLLVRDIDRDELKDKVGLVRKEQSYLPSDYDDISLLLLKSGVKGLDEVVKLVEDYNEEGIALVLCVYPLSYMNPHGDLEQTIAISLVLGNECEAVYGMDLTEVKEKLKNLVL